MSGVWAGLCMAGCTVALACAGAPGRAQSGTTVRLVPDLSPVVPMDAPINDRKIEVHALLEQFEDRSTGSSHNFRYEGLAWAGTDYDKLFLKFEGTRRNNGRFGDGINEVLYDRAISSYFDVQTGVRVDLDNGRTRTWYALGVQGLAVQFFNVEATAYASDAGHFAAKFNVSYDLQRARYGTAAALRDHQEVRALHRRFLPEGIRADGQLHQAGGGAVNDLRFNFGARLWF